MTFTHCYYLVIGFIYSFLPPETTSRYVVTTYIYDSKNGAWKVENGHAVESSGSMF